VVPGYQAPAGRVLQTEAMDDDPRGEGDAVRAKTNEALTAARRLEAWYIQEAGHVPAWLRTTSGETRWAVLGALAVAIAAQVSLPERFSLGPDWLLPAVEIGLVLGLTVANPVRLQRDSALIRRTSLMLVAVMSLANAGSAILLLRGIIRGNLPGGAPALLAAGAEVYVTNIVAFALWYWELDRGGPLARAAVRRPHPDFLFPQMATPAVATPGWRPTFLDYLYVSFTNATAFSPTDTMPLSRWSKMLMMLQSSVALVTAALVIARAVNIFK
jgi:hypothetical protein